MGHHNSNERREDFESTSRSQRLYLMVFSIFEGDLPLYVYAQDLVRRWSQAFSGSTKETQPDHEGSGKEGSIKVIRCGGDLPHF